jgi:hypothetical protein
MTVTGGPAYVISADVIPSAISVADTATVDLSVGAGPTYTLTADVIVPGAMFAQIQPPTLLKVTPDLTTSLNNANAVKILLTEVYDDDNAYDALTGLWTCPATGIYNFSFYVHLSEGLVGFTSGSIVAGITDDNGNIYHVVTTCGITNQLLYVDLNGCMLGLEMNIGTQVCLRVVNFSDVDYTTSSGDIAKMTIQKVK